MTEKVKTIFAAIAGPLKALNAIAVVALLVLWATPAAATTVNIGFFSFDDSGFADAALETSGPLDAGIAANLVGGDLTTSATFGFGDVAEVGFSDNTPVNFAGIDILVFESDGAENMTLALSGGPSVAGFLLQSVAAALLPAGVGIVNVYGFDLSDLGIAAGANLLEELFIGPSGSDTPEILAIASLNNSPAGLLPVPLPAALPLFGTGLIALGLAGWRRRKLAS